MNRLAAAIKAELFIARYSLGARLVVIAPLILACIQLIIAALGDASAATQQALLGAEAVPSNGYGNWVDSLVTGFIAQSLLITGVSAHSFAADRDLGALRHPLIRLSSRTQLVLVKFVLLHLLALSSVLLLVLGSWLLVLHFGSSVQSSKMAMSLSAKAKYSTRYILGCASPYCHSLRQSLSVLCCRWLPNQQCSLYRSRSD